MGWGKYNSGISKPDCGKDFTHETELVIDGKEVQVIWGSFKSDYIPENRTVVDTYIIETKPPEIRKKIGDTKLLELCIKAEEEEWE